MKSLRPTFRTQQGQALPLGIAFAMVGMLGAFVLFNTGQVAVTKQRLSDAADSAAYSAMVWQARALNFQAYTNRAMIANDVTIGQAVSLNSWANYAELASNNIAVVLRPVPVLNAFAATVAQMMTVVKNVVDPITDAMVTAVDMINSVLEVSQDAMFASAFLATPDIVHQVAKASDENFEDISAYAIGGLVMNLNAWNSFTEKYDQDDLPAMRERTDMISKSRDDFSANRRWKFFDSFWFMFPSPFTKHRLYYNGKTQLLMDDSGGGKPNWEWVAKDALSHHVKTYYFKRLRLRSRTNEIPFGWSSAYANSEGSSTKAIEPRRISCRNYTTTDGDPCAFLANNSKGEDAANAGLPGLSPAAADSGPNKLSGYSGVKAFRSLSELSLDDGINNGDPVLRLRTEISMDMEKVQTSNEWVHNSKQFATDVASAGKKMSSISIAEVYYRHPKAYVSSNQEISLQRANGYNPYWDVRLSPVDYTERLIALGLREGFVGGSSAASTPDAEQLANYAPDNGFPDIDLGGNLNDTGAALGALASQMGLEDTAKDLVRGGITRFAGEDFSATALSVFEDIEGFSVDEVERKLKDLLRDALEDAVKAILSGVVQDQFGITDEQLDRAEQTANTALANAERITEDMERMKAAVMADVEAAFLSKIPQYESEVVRLREIIRIAEGKYAAAKDIIDGREHNDGPTPQMVALQSEIQSARRKITEGYERLIQSLTDGLVDSLRRHGANMFPDGIAGELVDYLADEIRQMVNNYLGLTDDERQDVTLDNPLVMDDDNDTQDIDDYSDDEVDDFEK